MSIRWRAPTLRGNGAGLPGSEMVGIVALSGRPLITRFAQEEVRIRGPAASSNRQPAPYRHCKRGSCRWLPTAIQRLAPSDR